MVKPLWRTVWKFLKKLKIELTYDPALPLLDIHVEKTIRKDTCGEDDSKGYMYPNVHSSTVYSSQDAEAT